MHIWRRDGEMEPLRLVPLKLASILNWPLNDCKFIFMFPSANANGAVNRAVIIKSVFILFSPSW